MKWFEGTIQEAISMSQHNKAIFLVYIADASDNSKTTSASLEEESIARNLTAEGFISVKLENGTETCRQFAQIYPVVLVPSLFFIGNDGVPLEIIGGAVSVEDLSSKLSTIITAHRQAIQTSSPSQSSEVLQASGTTSPEGSEEHATPISPLSASVVASESASSAASETSNTASQSAEDCGEMTAEEKLEHAKALVERTRRQKAEEEKQKEKEKEIERRKTGQMVMKMREQQKEKEIHDAVKERKKEKEEERLAREKVRQQIAQDRAEKAAQYKAEREEEMKKKKEEERKAMVERQAQAELDAAARSNCARLQFRLPDGSSNVHTFSPDATLAEVEEYVRTNIPSLPYRSFLMSTTYPRRIFEPADLHQTLRDLQLAPSASILILPPRRTAVAASASSSSRDAVGGAGGLSSFLWTILSPLVLVFNMLKNFLFGGPPPPPVAAPPAPSGQRKRGAEDGEASTSSGGDRPHTAYKRRNTPNTTSNFRQEGNIHRLGNNRNDDDDNNTWNGNSTEQM